MAVPSPKIWFLYDNRRDVDRMSVTASDEQVQSADFEDIAPFIATRLSMLLGTTIPQITLSFWKLNEPRYFQLPADVPLEDIAKQVGKSSPIQSYVSRGDALVNLIVKSQVFQAQKRPHEEADDDVVERAKRAKVAKESPSSLAQSMNFRGWHKDTEKWLIDHRRHDTESPQLEDDLPPISLQYEGFGHFLDIFRGRTDIPDMDKVPPAILQLAVDVFADNMSLVYSDEVSRKNKGLGALNDVLSARTDYLFLQLVPAVVGERVVSDGHILGSHGALSCIVEFKNEPTGTSIPYVEMAGYFIQSLRDAALRVPSLVRAWNFPCLGLTIVGTSSIIFVVDVLLTITLGHYITFYAMIYFGQWRIVSLTPAISCIRASGDGDDRDALYKAFTAASVLLDYIHKDASKLVANPRPPIKGKRMFPSITLRDPRSPSCIEFEVLDPFPSRATGRFLYMAKTTDGKEIVVKFTRRYSSELHMFCEDKGCAPKLLGFQRLPGGFLAIAMDVFHSAVQITASSSGTKTREWGERLTKLVADFHAAGFVHGDLRSPNIICDEEMVMVIDFDWAGKEGEVFYPNGSLNPDLTDGRESTDLKITKTDDRRVLCKTLRRMQLECDYCRSKSPRLLSPA